MYNNIFIENSLELIWWYWFEIWKCAPSQDLRFFAWMIYRFFNHLVLGVVLTLYIMLFSIFKSMFLIIIVNINGNRVSQKMK